MEYIDVLKMKQQKEASNMRKNKMTSNNPTISIIRQALALNKKPIPWLKAFLAGLAAGMPVLVGLLFQNFFYGLLAGLGGFTYLYVFNIPYAQRAKKLILVVIGLTAATALGTYAAPYPIAIAFMIGIIGALGIFIFGALRIAGPSAIFFVLVFALTTGMPIQPDQAFIRAGLVFLGGSFSWLLAMIGWFIEPHGPETKAVKTVFYELANLVDAIGTDTFTKTKHQVMTTLQASEETLAAGHIPWRVTDQFKHLYVLNSHANKIFFYVIENFSQKDEKLPKELGETIRIIANNLGVKKKKDLKTKIILQPEKIDHKVVPLFQMVYHAEAVMNEPISKIDETIEIRKPSLKTVFYGAFDKNSIVFISAIRFGIIVTIAAIIGYEFEFTRSYWVPLSCVAVMSGATIVATFHRAIQRGFGTVFGILIASLILATNPSGYMVAFFIFILTFITELFIVKNYGLAALFFTPNALLIAESTSPNNIQFSQFASARLIDVLVGSMIGLIGIYLVGRKSASSRLPHLISKTIRSQAQLLYVLFSDQGAGFTAKESRELRKMRTNLINLKTLYNTATGEVPVNQKAVDYYWPVVYKIDHIGYLLESYAKKDHLPRLSDDVLSGYLLACETIANAINRKKSPDKKDITDVPGFPNIKREFNQLQNLLQLEEEINFHSSKNSHK